jgi:hypothetical protein
LLISLSSSLPSFTLSTTMIPETLGPFLAFAGTQHLQLSNHLAHSRRLVDTQRPPSLLAAVFSPRRTLEIALAFAFTTAISLVLGLWNRWSAFVDGLVRPIKITIESVFFSFLSSFLLHSILVDSQLTVLLLSTLLFCSTTASHPVLNPSPISHPAGSQGQKRPHSPQNSFIAASLPPSKHSRTTADSTPPAAKPSNLQSNPVPGESYAAAVKADTVASSGPSSLLPLPDLPQGTTSTTEQIDDPDSPIIEKTTINIPFASLDQLNLGQAVNSSSDNPSSSPVVTTTTTSTATTDTQDASSSSSAAAAHPTPASELPPTRPAAPSSLNGVSSSSQPSSTIQEEASPYINNRDALAEQSDDQEDQGGNGEHGHAEGIEVHSDVKGAFSYAKVAEKGEHAKASEVEPST